MNEIRKIKKIYESKPMVEGAGVNLNRVFGFNEPEMFDPFLLLDDFRSDDPADYMKGFPWHPHRGIETITYVLAGNVEHSDSLGNKGVIGPGDVQWMTAGSGIIHQELPEGDDKGRMHGFQLWANLPAVDKMMDPRYREFSSEEIPELKLEKGVAVRVIAGKIEGTEGPVKDVIIDPEFLDVSAPGGVEWHHPVKRGHTVFAYVIEGEGYLESNREVLFRNGMLALFDEGDEVEATAKSKDFRFLLLSGKPLKEPIAWNGPIVMNTKEELRTAFEEYYNETFIKNKTG